MFGGEKIMDLFGRKAARELKRVEDQNQKLLKQIQSLHDDLESYKKACEEFQKKIDGLRYTEYEKIQAAIEDGNKIIAQNSATIMEQNDTINELTEKEAALNKQLHTSTNKLIKSREIYKSIEYSISHYADFYSGEKTTTLSPEDIQVLDDLAPSIILKLHCMDIQDLRRAFRDNNRQIEFVFNQYAVRYTTKTNQAIYKLMVIALKAELQNVLYDLKYEKLDRAIDNIKKITKKYLEIASDGNQSIAGTLSRFIGEIEYLFINAVKIEYNYYIKKEQARQEQAAIREQIRQEAAERRALEEERKKIEQEESKYTNEIERIKSQLENASETEANQLQQRIISLESKLSDVLIKKDNIINLQNGKAGNIYIISNLGSFGENIFKIGMTRRINPQDRIDELGDASVPFKFDVHSFIFSEDAVDLESRLHDTLKEKRVNKVNLRKEFFYSTVEELEKLVMEIDPSAEFTKTMLAEEFRQSQLSEKLYTSTYKMEDYVG